ncbi:MAG: thiamine-phosphate kinase [Candidatus Omnitrophota bacterium]|nr:thiamine-phosphate kinase [Candidatus Omnitrophota bacterium]MDZ4241823.1 thiamine-phosphate kinase [Candidatus Omnitrophota bacterium]
MLLKNIGEFGLIDLIKKRVRCVPSVVKGIGDDTAVMAHGRGGYLLFTTDMMAEGTHFRRSDDALAIGHKALACNISDIAAMGGRPTYATVSLGIAPGTTVEAVRALYRGMERLARRCGVSIVGGDTIRSEKLVINVSLLGEARKSELVTRAGAKKGHWIFVSGPLGRSFPSGKHLTFNPRLAESRFLVKRFRPSAMIDVSDGLAADLGHILEASRVGAVVREADIPLSRGATVKQALEDGEDFELLFTVPPQTGRALAGLKSKKFHFYLIGEIVDGRGLALMGRMHRKTRISTKGFTHF